jgi:hypothetical protein
MSFTSKLLLKLSDSNTLKNYWEVFLVRTVDLRKSHCSDQKRKRGEIRVCQKKVIGAPGINDSKSGHQFLSSQRQDIGAMVTIDH